MSAPDDEAAEVPEPRGSAGAQLIAWAVGGAATVAGVALVTGEAAPAVVVAVLVAITCRLAWTTPRSAPRAHGLPGYGGPRHDLPRLRRIGRLTTGIGWIAAVGLAFVAPLCSVLGALLALAGMALEPLGWLDDGRRLRRALERHAPTIALAYAGTTGGPWQIAMWEPYLLASQESCIIINRHEFVSEMIRRGAAPRSPFVDLGGLGFANLRFVAVESIRAMFYVQNAESNAHFLALSGRTHVWIGHGESDKPASFNERHARYDLLALAGPAAVERYAANGIDVPAEKFVLIGRPQVAGIEGPRPRPWADPRVLYAPTWAGIDPSVNFSSLRIGPQIVRAMLDRGLTVVFRPHPLSERGVRHGELIAQIHALLERDRRATGRQHVWGEQATRRWSIVDCANHVDMLVSDVSSVVGDFLPSGKPYAMTMMRHDDPKRFRAENSLARGGYLIGADLATLPEVLDAMLGDDPLAGLREEVRRHVLTDRSGEESAACFAELVRGLARGQVPS